MIALLDNTVISNFSFVQRSDLVLAALGHTAAAMQEVFAEHTRGVLADMLNHGYRAPVKSVSELR